MKQLIFIAIIFLSALSLDCCSDRVGKVVVNYGQQLNEWVIITDRQGEPQLVRKETLETIEGR